MRGGSGGGQERGAERSCALISARPVSTLPYLPCTFADANSSHNAPIWLAPSNPRPPSTTPHRPHPRLSRPLAALYLPQHAPSPRTTPATTPDVTREPTASARLPRRRRTKPLASLASNPDPDPLPLAHQAPAIREHPPLQPNPPSQRLPGPASPHRLSSSAMAQTTMIRVLVVLVPSPSYIRRRPRPHCALAAQAYAHAHMCLDTRIPVAILVPVARSSQAFFSLFPEAKPGPRSSLRCPSYVLDDIDTFISDPLEADNRR